jgi:DNA-binding CsgD family transcriptional regulator/tetratricopeptide (TPR) repeat protein
VTVLLERERELGELRAALADVGAGTGRAVAIEANAGLGKTRLLAEARAAGDEEGLNLLSGRATELERDFPFALVRQLFESRLATLAPQERRVLLEGASAACGALGLDAGRGGSDDPFAVLHGLYWVTAALAERRPLLLAIDDAHWADASSLDYLGFLLPRLEELPVLLVVTFRPDQPDSPPGLGRILADPIVRHLTPGPLGPGAAGTLLAQMWGREPDPTFAATCHEVSGGNPFLLSELAHNLLAQGIEPAAERAAMVREQAPDRVARTVLMRVAKLPSEARVVARSLAVLGDGSDLSLLTAMDGIDPEVTQKTADELRASAIFDSGSPLRFVHPLVRNVVYSDMSVGERSRAHARAAALLRERRVSPERVATQLLATEARGERTTVEALLDAGEQALGAGAPRSAIAYLSRALREPPPPELRAAVLDRLLTASFRAADQAAFAAVEDDVLAEWALDPSIRSRWAIQLTMLMALGGRFEEAAALLREAIEVAVAEDDVERAYQLQAQLSTLASMVPSVPEVTVVDHAGRIDPDSPIGRLVAAMETRSAAVHGTSSEVVDAAKRALGNDCIIFAEEPELAAASIAVMSLVAVDEVETAHRAAKRALSIARKRGATPELVRARLLLGFCAWGAGDLVTAEADLRQGIDLARLAGIVPLVLMGVGSLLEVLIERDELSAAETELQGLGMADGPVPANPLLGMVLMMRGHLRVERGEFELAAEDFSDLAVLAEAMGFGLGPVASASPFAVRALSALGRHDEARELADSMVPYAQHLGTRSAIAHVSRAIAATRKDDEAIEVLETATGLLENSPRRLERAHTLVDLGSALRRAGRRADARTPLREAFELARRCGAARIARRANSELEATGEKVRRYTPIGVESLTPSERRVADLAASGMTNRQIAQSLFVTVKTVEAHLSAAYDKLDISSRRQLPAALGGEAPPAA